MKKLLMIMAIVVVDFILLSLITELVSSRSDYFVGIGVIILCAAITGNYYFIKLIQAQK